MSDYLRRACAQLGIEQDSVIEHRKEGDDLVILADLGIKGAPKYRVPLSQLEEPEPEPKPDPLSEYGYRELQTLAKAEGIAANQSAGALRAALGYVTGAEEE